MKLLGVVTIYHPDTELLRESLLRYVSSLDKLILWVNSPAEDMDIIERLDLPEEVAARCEAMTSGRNEFISYPMNRAVEYGLEHGYTHLLTMDQDSLFDEGDFARLVEMTECHGGRAVYCPRIHTEAFVDEVQHRRTMEELRGVPEPEEVKCSITSGTIYPLDMFAKTGLFREDYEIDMVDVELGVRARLCGFPTLKFNSIPLHQKYGDTKMVMGKPVFNYSPMRRYYRARNRVVFKREYPEVDRWSDIISNLGKDALKIVLFEPGKWKKLSAVVRGVKEGLLHKTMRMDRAIAEGAGAKAVEAANKK